jgi:predicted N-acetyltransferase YhbS
MISIRLAQESDINNIVNLINAAFRVEAFFVDGDRTNSESVSQLFTSGTFLIAEISTKPIGCIYLELRGESGYFGLLSVEPVRQRSGLGRQLVDAAEDYFREAGCRVSELLAVNVREELQPYYRKLGYVETGVAPFPVEVETKIPCHFIKMAKVITN